MLQYLVLLGAAVNLGGTSYYIKKTWRGEIKPNRVSWLMWSIIPLIATAAALSDGVTWAALPVFMSGFTPLLVLIASFANKNAYWKLRTFDYVCGALSALALVLWAITKEPNIAIALTILSDFIAAVPTLVKSWKYPETESAASYAGGVFSALTGFAAIKMWGFSSLAFPIYLIIIDSSFIIAIWRREFLKMKKQLLFKTCKILR